MIMKRKLIIPVILAVVMLSGCESDRPITCTDTVMWIVKQTPMTNNAGNSPKHAILYIDLEDGKSIKVRANTITHWIGQKIALKECYRVMF